MVLNAERRTPYAQTRFIADVMLGRLARWLRLLGFDTLYFRAIDDNALVKTALQEERILLTRDTGIARRKKNLSLILIHSNNTIEQLKEVLFSFPDSTILLLADSAFGPARCTLCNGELARADMSSVAGRVPEYVLLNAASFFTCRECGKVYWHGSHKKSIDNILKKILEKLK